MATQTRKPPAKRGPEKKKPAAAMANSLVLVPRTKLKVRDGFNPRTKIDEVELDGLAQSIVSRGMLTPLLVASTTSGYELVAGHRRIAAVDRAIKAGDLPKDVTLPAFLRDRSGELEDAVAENFNRVDLNPLEEAEAFERLRKGGLTAKGIAESVGVAPRRVTERLRILECPKSLQPKFATGELSVQVAKDLADLTKFDRRLAEITGKALADRRDSGAGFGRSGIGYWAAWAVQHGDGKKGDLRVLHNQGGKRFYINSDALGAVPHKVAEQLVAIKKDQDAVRGYNSGYGWQVPLDQAAIDTLRANGVIFESKDDYGDRTVVCKDMAALRSVVEPIIDREHKEALKREANRRRAKEQGGNEAAAKEDEKAREYAVMVAARDYNLRLGAALIRSFSTVELSADVIRFLALAPSMTASTGYYDDQSIRAELFQRGMRYIDTRYQDEKLVKSTGRTKVTYWSTKSGTNDCVAAFTEWWELATTPQEIAGRTIIAWAAATYARQEVVSRSQQPYGPNLRDDAAKALTAVVAKKVPKWESPDPAERAREQANGLSILQADVLAVIAADEHSIGGSEATMLTSIVEKMPDDVQGQPRTKTAVRDAIRTMKDAKLLDGVLAGGIEITAAGVEVAKALGCDVGPRAAKKAAKNDDEGAADEAAPEASARPVAEGQRSKVCGDLIRAKPGITIPQLAEAMGIKQNYLYRLLPSLETNGMIRKEGRGWHPVGADPQRAEQTELTENQVRVMRALMDGVTPKPRQKFINALAQAAALDGPDEAEDAIAALTQLGLVANGEKAPYVTKQGGEVLAALTTKAEAA